RQVHSGRLLVTFQPHLYSRTRDYAEDFGAALAKADALILAHIYPAREPPIPGVSSRLITEAARKFNSEVIGPFALEQAAAEAGARAGDFEAVVFMGAGDIDAAARRLAEKESAG
ncbi:MAG: UDP-N-acetylmuramate--L-alanine ligase, partial [Planctomycetota bacterium]|nr:UDP-N-acetylmuramate--L-alanine ligase [Planctomycetota bacterium]